jgi:hypothetical protein
MATTLTGAGGTASFEVLRDGDGGFPQWEPGEVRIAEFPVIGLSETIRQKAGKGDRHLGIAVRVANAAVVTTLEGMTGGTALYTLAGYPSPEGDLTYGSVDVLQVRKPRWIGVARANSAAGVGIVEIELARPPA